MEGSFVLFDPHRSMLSNRRHTASGRSCQTAGMDETQRWWPQLRRETRAWLVANNGDTVPADIAREIKQADAGAALVGSEDDDISGVHLSDEAADWIEAVANDEEP